MAVLLVGFVDGALDRVGMSERPVDQVLQKKELKNVKLDAKVGGGSSPYSLGRGHRVEGASSGEGALALPLSGPLRAVFLDRVLQGTIVMTRPIARAVSCCPNKNASRCLRVRT